MGNPVHAGVADAFDSHGTSSGADVCYEAPNKSKVCIQDVRAMSGVRTASVVDSASSQNGFADTFFVNCNTGDWERYGTMSDANSEAFAEYVCSL